MALNFPNSPSTNDTYTDSNSAVWQYDGVKWDVVTSSTRKVFSGAKVSNSSIVNLTASSSAISWDTETFDVDNYFDSGLASRLKAPLTGFYRIVATITTSSDGVGSNYTILIKKNGTTNLVTTTAGANQTVVYDEIVELSQDDYIELYASESNSVGDLAAGSTFEMHRMGLSLGTGVSANQAFSGVRGVLTSVENATSTLTAIPWDTTDFNVNADVLGNTYWDAGTPSIIRVKTDGFFRIKSFVQAGSGGSLDSYTVTLRKNGATTLETTSLSPNDFVDLDEVYSLADSDYVELLILDSDNSGSITTDSYLEVVRLGL